MKYINEIENENKLYKPIIYNLEIITDAINEYYSDEFFYSDEFKSEILNLVTKNSDNIYSKRNSDEYASENKSYTRICYEISDEYYLIGSDAYSILNLLDLFNEIISEYRHQFKLYENSSNESYYSNFKAFELIEYILDAINKLYAFKDSEIYDITFQINNQYAYIYNNDLLSLNHEFLSEYLYSDMIYNDIHESVISDLYDSGMINILISDEIDLYDLYENVYLNFINHEYTENIDIIRNKDEYAIYLNLKDLMKINEIISESDKYEMSFNLENITEIFENFNNSLDESFLYAYYDEFSEYIRNVLYDKYYYEIISINSSRYNFKKCYDIFELIESVLNQLKHYDLKNSFKFNKSCYEIY